MWYCAMVMSLSHQGDVTFGAFQAPAGNTGSLFGCIATLGADAFCRRVATPLAAPTKGDVSHCYQGLYFLNHLKYLC
jgi:hypothetical protein